MSKSLRGSDAAMSNDALFSTYRRQNVIMGRFVRKEGIRWDERWMMDGCVAVVAAKGRQREDGRTTSFQYCQDDNGCI